MTEDIIEKLREIEHDIASVQMFLKEESYADAWTYLEEIADDIMDIKDKVKGLFKKNGGSR